MKENKIEVYKAKLTSGTVYVKTQRYAKTRKNLYMIHLDPYQSSGLICRKIDGYLNMNYSWPNKVVKLSSEMVEALPKKIQNKIESLKIHI